MKQGTKTKTVDTKKKYRNTHSLSSESNKYYLHFYSYIRKYVLCVLISLKVYFLFKTENSQQNILAIYKHMIMGNNIIFQMNDFLIRKEIFQI